MLKRVSKRWPYLRRSLGIASPCSPLSFSPHWEEFLSGHCLFAVFILVTLTWNWTSAWPQSGSLFLPLVLKPYWPLCPGGTSSLLPACGCCRSCVSLFSAFSNRLLPGLPGDCWVANLHCVLSWCHFRLESCATVVRWPALATYPPLEWLILIMCQMQGVFTGISWGLDLCL